MGVCVCSASQSDSEAPLLPRFNYEEVYVRKAKTAPCLHIECNRLYLRRKASQASDDSSADHSLAPN